MSESLTYWLSSSFPNSDDRHRQFDTGERRLDFVLLSNSGGRQSEKRPVWFGFCYGIRLFLGLIEPNILYFLNFTQIFQKFCFRFAFRVTRCVRPTIYVSCCDDVTKDQLLNFHWFKGNSNWIWSIFFAYKSLIFLLDKNWQRKLNISITVRNFSNDFFFSMAKSSKKGRQK